MFTTLLRFGWDLLTTWKMMIDDVEIVGIEDLMSYDIEPVVTID